MCIRRFWAVFLSIALMFCMAPTMAFAGTETDGFGSGNDDEYYEYITGDGSIKVAFEAEHARGSYAVLPHGSIKLAVDKSWFKAYEKVAGGEWKELSGTALTNVINNLSVDWYKIGDNWEDEDETYLDTAWSCSLTQPFGYCYIMATIAYDDDGESFEFAHIEWYNNYEFETTGEKFIVDIHQSNYSESAYVELGGDFHTDFNIDPGLKEYKDGKWVTVDPMKDSRFEYAWYHRIYDAEGELIDTIKIPGKNTALDINGIRESDLGEYVLTLKCPEYPTDPDDLEYYGKNLFEIYTIELNTKNYQHQGDMAFFVDDFCHNICADSKGVINVDLCDPNNNSVRAYMTNGSDNVADWTEVDPEECGLTFEWYQNETNRLGDVKGTACKTNISKGNVVSCKVLLGGKLLGELRFEAAETDHIQTRISGRTKACEGKTVTLVNCIMAANIYYEDTDVQYQWYKRAENTDKWVEIKGATESTLDITMSATATYYCNTRIGFAEADAFHTVALDTSDHNWDEGTIIKDAGCTTPGIIHFVCTDPECGEEFNDTIPVLGHMVESDENGYSPTCGKNGMTSSTHCGRCNIILSEQEVIPSTGHVYVQEVKTPEYFRADPTCTEGKTYFKSCDCGKSSEGSGLETYFEVGDPLGHDTKIGNYKAPTCTEAGYTGDEICERCHKTMSKGSAIAKLGHHIIKVEAVPATCQETGRKAHYECDQCGQWYTDAKGKYKTTEAKMTVAMKPHAFTEKIMDEKHFCSEATCTSAAKYYLECSMCHEISDTKTFDDPAHPKLGHNIIKVEAVAATCQETGRKAHYECDRCGQWYTDAKGKYKTTEAKMTVAKKAHAFTEKIMDEKHFCSEATCTAAAKYCCPAN